MNKVTFLVGNIGSGKTTFLDTVTESSYIISKDDLREVFGESVGKEYLWDTTLEEIIHDVSLDMFEGFLHIGTESLYIDETNISKESRAPFLLLAKKYGYLCKAIVFKEYNKDVHVNRRMRESRGFPREYWESVYDDKQARFEDPDFEEFDIIEHLTV